jgi:hypothetical protein
MIPFDGLSDIRARRRRCIDAATDWLTGAAKIALDSGGKESPPSGGHLQSAFDQVYSFTTGGAEPATTPDNLPLRSKTGFW